MAGSLRYTACVIAAALTALAFVAAFATSASAAPIEVKTKVILVSSDWDPETGTFDLLGSLQTRDACRGRRTVFIFRGGNRVKAKSLGNGDFLLEGMHLPAEETDYTVRVGQRRLPWSLQSGRWLRCQHCPGCNH